jgi:uncharacterized protein
MELDRSINWRSLTDTAIEHCHVIGTPRDTRIRSAVVGPRHGAFYRIKLDEAGHVRTARLDRTDGQSLELFSDGAGNWSDDRADPLPELRGCIDIDISFTPLTNSLPIWRSEWQTGQPRRFSMAWIDADAMTVFRDDQIYTRLDPTHFHYQAADGSFERDIEIDGDGLVRHYPGLFEAISQG